MNSRALGAAALLLMTACAPRITPLSGAPVPVERLPAGAIPSGRYKTVFSWDLQDRDMTARGEGVARLATPDSARLDLFLAGGFGGGGAILIGDSLAMTGPDFVRRLIPSPTLLWAAFGRVALPNLPDTVIKIEGSTLRADLGRPLAWRLTFRGDTLLRAERVAGGRVVEWLERPDATHVLYRDEAARRSLHLAIQRTEGDQIFDASIWRFDR